MYGLEIFWYIVFIASVTCYAMLDGFDLGVGALHLFARKDIERRIFLNAIGPVWDGNEVWLVVVIGGMFAGFPYAYATLFSAFYLPFTILIVALIFRAVSIEFRSKRPMRWWRSMWDMFFFFGSVMIALCVGITLGNLVQGIPLDADHNYVGGNIVTFLHPYAVLVGILTLSMFMMHGSIYLIMKTEGALQERLKTWMTPSIIFFIIAYAVTTMVTLIYQDHMVQKIKEHPYLFVLALANMLLIANIPREIHRGKAGWAFLSSCGNIALLMVLFALGNFPYLIRSSIDPLTNSLTIINSSSSETTLIVLAVIVGIGLPLVFAYGYYVYRIFRGKVEIDHMSY